MRAQPAAQPAAAASKLPRVSIMLPTRLRPSSARVPSAVKRAAATAAAFHPYQQLEGRGNGLYGVWCYIKQLPIHAHRAMLEVDLAGVNGDVASEDERKHCQQFRHRGTVNILVWRRSFILINLIVRTRAATTATRAITIIISPSCRRRCCRRHSQYCSRNCSWHRCWCSVGLLRR